LLPPITLRKSDFRVIIIIFFCAGLGSGMVCVDRTSRVRLGTYLLLLCSPSLFHFQFNLERDWVIIIVEGVHINALAWRF
jgi:hypothetical protein